MKAIPTRVEIVDEEMKQLVATVEAVDDVVVQVNIKQVLGWHDWHYLADAVRKAMIMMEMNVGTSKND